MHFTSYNCAFKNINFLKHSVLNVKHLVFFVEMYKDASEVYFIHWVSSKARITAKSVKIALITYSWENYLFKDVIFKK